ncbi:MAG: hypothetical protein JWO77_510 [Ilumatobacteraceae bacterium]|nr:hypothetical protein [Ilumatobacteraceae bacterium]
MTRLDLVVGPNGAGKTSFVTSVLRPVHPGAPFVNADEIAKARWPGDEEAHAYDASRAASDARAALIGQRRAFIAETVCSHPSKLDLIDDAQASGYDVALHVVLVPLELAKARVIHRVAAGGHSVPVEKITARFDRLWVIVAEAIDRCDTASCWDNSRFDGPSNVAAFTSGEVDRAPKWPSWASKALTQRWPAEP